MPRKVGKPCRVCHVVIFNGTVFCDDHRPKSGWDKSHGDQRRHDRNLGNDWYRIVKLIRRRDNHLCQPCQRNGVASSVDSVDHIIPRAYGGTHDHSNLESICEACHKQKTADDRKKYRGFIKNRSN